jgi:mRNA-degrading endonuclease RelE of RelBE toxin-antitoxin system
VAYSFEYTKDAIQHIRKLPGDRQATVMDQLEERLAHQPTVPVRNRKPMDPDKKPTWRRGSRGSAI